MPRIFDNIEQSLVTASAQSAIYNLQSEMPRGRIGFGPHDSRAGSSSDFVVRDTPPPRRARQSATCSPKSRIYAPARRPTRNGNGRQP
jgi:hypothetical protein